MFFAKTNPLIVWIVPTQKFSDLVKTSIFYALLNATIISSTAEQWEIWDEPELWRQFENPSKAQPSNSLIEISVDAFFGQISFSRSYSPTTLHNVVLWSRFRDELQRLYHLETNFTSEYEIEAEHDVAHCSTDVNKTKEVRKIAKSTASDLDVTLENVQKLVDSIQDQFDSSSKVMSTLQGITNKHVEKYTCLFSDSNISGRVKRKPQKANLSSRKRNKKQLHERLEAYKKHIKNPL